MRDIAKFINGFKRFQDSYFCGDEEVFQRLRSGQNPRALVIGCCDSRVDPAILTDSAPGDLFVVRNVANLVPPREEDGGRHGVSAALEFAVRVLRVEHVIVMGHSACGGIRSLMRGEFGQASEFLPHWVDIMAPARERVLRELPGKSEELQERACEQAAVLVSLDNLLTFPWVRERVEAGDLLLHGWYFDLERGELLSYLPQSGQFEPLVPRCEAG
ncbi:carbonic anhydrase [Desulfovibrio aminophilus]|uniref:carbonic anhydrase n=1 Tax=Desulfovibrio aminophilus TaxID=81425 RepID=UPI003393FACB